MSQVCAAKHWQWAHLCTPSRYKLHDAPRVFVFPRTAWWLSALLHHPSVAFSAVAGTVGFATDCYALSLEALEARHILDCEASFSGKFAQVRIGRPTDFGKSGVHTLYPFGVDDRAPNRAECDEPHLTFTYGRIVTNIQDSRVLLSHCIKHVGIGNSADRL